MDRWKGLLVVAVLVVAVSLATAGPAAAQGDNNAKARTAKKVQVHGTTSQGKPITLTLHPTLRKIGINFGFTVTCFGVTAFPYEDVAQMNGKSTPYTVSGGGRRLETRVRYNFRASATTFRPTDTGIVYGTVEIRITGVIRDLAGTHPTATGTIQPTATLVQPGAGFAQCTSGETPITYSASGP